MKQYSAILLSVLVTVALTANISRASGEWLDSPAKPWNKPGQSRLTAVATSNRYWP
jgi:hypothetical protein